MKKFDKHDERFFHLLNISKRSVRSSTFECRSEKIERILKNNQGQGRKPLANSLGELCEPRPALVAIPAERVGVILDHFPPPPFASS